MKYDLIVTDLDDTLLRDDRTISLRSKQTIARAAERGITVAVATGRMYASAIPYARELGLTGPILCCQGAYIADIETGAPIAKIGVPLALAREVLAFAADEGVYAQYYDTEGYFFERECWQSDFYAAHTGVTGQALGRPVADTLDYDPIKVLLLDEPERIRALYEVARQRFAGRLEVAISKPHYLEFTHPEAHKGAAVKALAERMGIPQGRVMAAGDALNDLSMIEWAGLGVAMGNGDERVRRRADVVTGTNEEDGVAQAIEHYALEE